MSRKRRPSVIRRLRAAYPGEAWEYVPDPDGTPWWFHVDSGRAVRAYANRDDMLGEPLYRWNDTGELALPNELAIHGDRTMKPSEEKIRGSLQSAILFRGNPAFAENVRKNAIDSITTLLDIIDELRAELLRSKTNEIPPSTSIEQVATLRNAGVELVGSEKKRRALPLANQAEADGDRLDFVVSYLMRRGDVEPETEALIESIVDRFHEEARLLRKGAQPVRDVDLASIGRRVLVTIENFGDIDAILASTPARVRNFVAAIRVAIDP